eukprot:TRINITY_DN4152_c1_g1_i1.p1 TRINITY_DN4152_c1_g1~~TRINITY_DN4152_c1_g1_i1.p1  ORF type:complete len:221 (+),score=43.23 TRINITY_DN4152_c1_g1_i1:53-715(+)
MSRGKATRSKAMPWVALAAVACITFPVRTWQSAFMQPRSAERKVSGRRQLFSVVATGLGAAYSATDSASALELFNTEIKRTSQRGGIEARKQAIPYDQRASQKLVGREIGEITTLKNTCWETDNIGLKANPVSGVMVYDKNAPCGEGEAFIHSAGPSDFAPMTAGGGPAKHKYTASTFDDAELVQQYKASVGKCAKVPKGGKDSISWEVANTERGGMCNF